MKFSNIQPISFLKTNTSDVVKQAQETQEPAAITVNGKVQAIVQDPSSYQKTQDQLTMLRILAHGRKQVEEGKVTDHDDFFAQPEAEDSESHSPKSVTSRKRGGFCYTDFDLIRRSGDPCLR